ncbi:unnamed protein product, partial [Symbiodinium pilosum]
ASQSQTPDAESELIEPDTHVAFLKWMGYKGRIQELEEPYRMDEWMKSVSLMLTHSLVTQKFKALGKDMTQEPRSKQVFELYMEFLA